MCGLWGMHAVHICIASIKENWEIVCHDNHLLLHMFFYHLRLMPYISHQLQKEQIQIAFTNYICSWSGDGGMDSSSLSQCFWSNRWREIFAKKINIKCPTIDILSLFIMLVCYLTHWFERHLLFFSVVFNSHHHVFIVISSRRYLSNHCQKLWFIKCLKVQLQSQSRTKLKPEITDQNWTSDSSSINSQWHWLRLPL